MLFSLYFFQLYDNKKNSKFFYSDQIFYTIKNFQKNYFKA